MLNTSVKKIVPRGIIKPIPRNISSVRFLIWVLWILHRYRLPYIALYIGVFSIVSFTTATPIISFIESMCIFEGVMLSFAVHETSHWIIATKKYGIKADYISFIPYLFSFSVSFREEGIKLEPGQRAKIYIAGPLIPIVLFSGIAIICTIIGCMKFPHKPKACGRYRKVSAIADGCFMQVGLSSGEPILYLKVT